MVEDITSRHRLPEIDEGRRSYLREEVDTVIGCEGINNRAEINCTYRG